MAKRWGDYIRQMKQQYFIGREQEKELFMNYLQNEQLEKILYYWGPGGTGKSTLLDEFSRLSAEEDSYFLYLDSRDFLHSPQDFSKRILSLINGKEASGGFDECIADLHTKAEQQKVVLAIDTYEEMKDMDEWLREDFFGELNDQFLVVMAGRYPLDGEWLNPVWKRMVRQTQLAFFDLETTKNYAASFSQYSEAYIQRIYSLSKGHPLTLSLMMGLSEQDFSEDSPGDIHKLLKRVAESWLLETRDPFLQELINAAAMVRVFNQETLEEMLQKTISVDEFGHLVSLSFIRSSKRGWFVHDLLRPVLIQEFKLRKPTVYRALSERLIAYLHNVLTFSSSETEKALAAVDLVFTLEDYTLRSIFLTETSESSYYAAPVTASQLEKAKDYMKQVLSGKLDVIQEFYDPQTHQRYESIMPFRYIENAYKIINLDEWIHLSDDVIFLIKNEQHQPVSMVVNIPIHRDSLPILMKSPISKHYFKNLSKTELEKLKSSPDSPSGWYFYHIDQWLDHSPPARTAFFQFIMLNLMKPGLFLHSSPLKLHQDTVANLGFTEVAGAEHDDYGSEFHAKTFQLDLRGEKYKYFMERLIRIPNSGTDVSVPGPKRAENLTPREKEIVEWVLKGLTNVEIAKNLYVSEVTIKKHLGSIYEKLGIKGKAQLIKKMLD
ncbi:LuxR C-terminal-related transcriptional regulator [Neobacillus sp. SAB-20_R2A]|uniref:LuxR C-terminal-related transcriptional regulator n=1 Tax=Neobacillus sp. SAB-20_R2A TaxID=3120519 RepID=UPI003C6DD25C